MTAPTPEQQIQFLTSIQRLLSEGQFVATYKYALLQALADLAVERGDDAGNSLTLQTYAIAEKFIQYYWKQVLPYIPTGTAAGGVVLRQNTGKPAKVLSLIQKAQGQYGSIANAKHDAEAYRRLVNQVRVIVQTMPLWKLQTVGRGTTSFLYQNIGSGETIKLQAVAVFCLRRFQGLVRELVRASWIQYVRRNNLEAFGATTDLGEFLFGSERSDLSMLQPALRDLQSGVCFYCGRALSSQPAHVDHFIPWSKYPVDFGHNFVLAHARCNSAKADHLAATDHLKAWVERNAEHSSTIDQICDDTGIVHDLHATVQIAHWSYQQAELIEGWVWKTGKAFVPLDSAWRALLG